MSEFIIGPQSGPSKPVGCSGMYRGFSWEIPEGDQQILSHTLLLSYSFPYSIAPTGLPNNQTAREESLHLRFSCIHPKEHLEHVQLVLPFALCFQLFNMSSHLLFDLNLAIATQGKATRE